MRAGRLLSLLLLLQGGGRRTAHELSERLGVSRRTVLRDIEALSSAGVPVFAVRGPAGGFELLDTYDRSLPPPAPGLTPHEGRLRRVRVRIAPAALQLALLTGRPDGWRPRAPALPDPERPDWLEGSFRFGSYEAAVRELLALAPEVEVLLPLDVREAVAAAGRRIAALNGPLRVAAAPGARDRGDANHSRARVGPGPASKPRPSRRA